MAATTTSASTRSAPAKYQLWRRSAGDRWAVVATADTEVEAWQKQCVLMDRDRGSFDWMILPGAEEP